MKRKDLIKENFGRHLQKLRSEQNLSLRKLAARSGLEYSQVQRIASGQVNVSLTTIYALAEGLDIPAAHLLTELS